MGIKQAEKELIKAIDVIRSECDYHRNQGYSGSCTNCPFLLADHSFCGIVSEHIDHIGNYKKAPMYWKTQQIKLMQWNEYSEELIKAGYKKKEE